MPLIRFPTAKGLVYTIDLSKISDRENPRTVEAPIGSTTGFTGSYTVDWGDGTTETFRTETYPTHTYAAGAGDVFRAVVRTADGKLPFIRALRTNSASEASNPQYNITWGIVSLDHFGGDIYQDTFSGSALFRGCKNLTYIDPRFVGQPKLTTISDIARGCNSLSMPVESFCFDFATQVTTFASCFYGCSGLTGSIPADLFKYNTSVTSFANCFYDCSGLTGSIPSDLFKYNTSVTSFASCFYGCSGLTGSIPADLFKYNTSVTTFYGAFYHCTGLTGPIPDGLFDTNILLTVAGTCFEGCTGLTQIPSDLFDNCPKLENLYRTFNGCNNVNLTEPYVFWKQDGSFDTVKIPALSSASASANQCYANCNGTLRSKVPTAYGGTMTVS